MSVQKREKDVEKYLVKRMGDIGFPCIKFVPEHAAGMPDRMILLNRGRVLWVEVKTDDGRLSVIQEYQHKVLRDSGQKVVVIWSQDDVDRLVGELTLKKCRKTS